MANPNSEWRDHGVHDRLRTAVQLLVRGKGRITKRLDDATFAMAVLQENDFPPGLEKRVENVKSVRHRVRNEMFGVVYFDFNKLSHKEKDELTEDILALYEASLIKLIKCDDAFEYLYPSDREARNR